jgi:plastocyanin
MSLIERSWLRKTGARLGAALTLATALGAAAAPSVDPLQSAPSIRIENFRFEPSKIVVERGSTVDWVNRDEEIHTILAVDGSFSSPGLDTDGRYAHEFDAPGTYTYRCALHPQMKGTIVVR